MRTTAAALALLSAVALAACGSDPNSPDLDAAPVDLGAELAAEAGPDAAVDLAVALDASPDAAGLDAAGDLEPDAVDAPDLGKAAVRCSPDLANCDGDRTNGCETNLTTNAEHCGRCGNACMAGYACTRAGCVFSAPPGCPRLCARTADCATCTNPGPWCCSRGLCGHGPC